MKVDSTYHYCLAQLHIRIAAAAKGKCSQRSVVVFENLLAKEIEKHKNTFGLQVLNMPEA
jgi:hypothetical protein